MAKKTPYVDLRQQFPDPQQFSQRWKFEQLRRYPSDWTQAQVTADREQNAQAIAQAAQLYQQQLDQEYSRTVTRLKQVAAGGLYNAPKNKVQMRDFSPTLRRAQTLIDMFRTKNF